MPFFALLALLLYAFFGAGIGSGSSHVAVTQADLVKGVVTRYDNHRTIAIGKPSDVTLQLPHHWSKPRLSGSSVQLEQIDFTVDPGFDAWRIVPVRPGTTAIRSTSPRGRPIRISIRVD